MLIEYRLNQAIIGHHNVLKSSAAAVKASIRKLRGSLRKGISPFPILGIYDINPSSINFILSLWRHWYWYSAWYCSWRCYTAKFTPAPEPKINVNIRTS